MVGKLLNFFDKIGPKTWHRENRILLSDFEEPYLEKNEEPDFLRILKLGAYFFVFEKWEPDFEFSKATDSLKIEEPRILYFLYALKAL